MLAWIYLSAAIATEVLGTVFLRETEGFTKPAPSIFVIATFVLSLWLTALALKSLEISLAYAVWAGVGTAAVAVIGMALLGESVNALKLASIALVIGGGGGLNLSGADEADGDGGQDLRGTTRADPGGDPASDRPVGSGGSHPSRGGGGG